jgi:hypothetical protein
MATQPERLEIFTSYWPIASNADPFLLFCAPTAIQPGENIARAAQAEACQNAIWHYLDTASNDGRDKDAERIARVLAAEFDTLRDQNQVECGALKALAKRFFVQEDTSPSGAGLQLDEAGWTGIRTAVDIACSTPGEFVRVILVSKTKRLAELEASAPVPCHALVALGGKEIKVGDQMFERVDRPPGEIVPEMPSGLKVEHPETLLDIMRKKFEEEYETIER